MAMPNEHDVHATSNSEQLGGTGQILALHVFWTSHAGSRRSASLPRPMSGRAMWHAPPSPHLSSPFASFRVFRGAHSLGKSGGPTRRDRSNIGVARFLDIPRRIAQERVPTASNVGARDVTWAPAHSSHPLSCLFACFAGPIPRQGGVVTETQFPVGLRVLCDGPT